MAAENGARGHVSFTSGGPSRSWRHVDLRSPIRRPRIARCRRDVGL